MSFQGHCHCGAVRASLETQQPAEEIQVRACQCGFCRRKGTRSVSDPQGHLHVTAAPGALRRYRFGTQSADFLLCRECGDYVAAVMQDGGRWLGVLNVRAVDLSAFADREAAPIDYSGEDAETRLARRRAKWTPATVVEAAPNA